MRTERQVLFWLAMALVLALAILALREILLPFVAGVVIAYALNPIANRLARLGLGRLGASIVVVALLVVLIAVILVFVVPLLIGQLQQLAASLPGELERGRTLLETWAKAQLGSRFGDFQVALDKAIGELTSNWSTIATYVAQEMWAQGQAVIGFVAFLLITPLVVFYLLVDWTVMLARLDSWLPRDQAPTIRRLAGEIDDAIAAFIRGQGLVCIMLGLYYAVTLTSAGIRYGLLIGLATGVLTFVPFVGWALGLITASVVAVVQGWPDLMPLVSVLAIYAGAQALDAGFLSPKIVGSKIGLHPVALIFALFVFSYLFGTVGVLVAVPLAAAAAVLMRFALEVYLGSRIYRGAAADAARETGPTARDV